MDWSPKTMLEEAIDEVKSIGKSKVLCAFSGGVDSLVAATLAQRVLKDDLYCFFVEPKSDGSFFEGSSRFHQKFIIPI